MDKEGVCSLYTMEVYSAVMNDKHPPFASTWMEPEGIKAEGKKAIGKGQTSYGLILLGRMKKIVKGDRGERREKLVGDRGKGD